MVTKGILEKAERHFGKIIKRVSHLAILRLDLREEGNPAITDKEVVTATLQLKGRTLRAEGSAPAMPQAIELAAQKMKHQVDHYLGKRKLRGNKLRATQPGP